MKAKRNKLRKFIIWTFILLVSFLPMNFLHAAAKNTNNTHIIYSYIVEYNIKKTGTVEVYMELEFAPLENTNSLQMSIPYKEGQSIAVSSFVRSELDNEGNPTNGVGVLQNTPLTADSDIGSYYVNDTGRSIEISMNSAIPAGEIRVLQVLFTLYQATARYQDIAVFNHNILPANYKADIQQLGVIYSIESPVYANEYNKTKLLEKNQLPKENLLASSDKRNFEEKLDYISTYAYDSFSSFYYYGEDIERDSGLEAELIMPSVWLSRMSPVDEAKENEINRNHDAYINHKRHIYVFRSHALRLTLALMVLALVLWFVFHFIRNRTLSQSDAKQEASMVYPLPAAIMSYLTSLQLNAKTLLVISLELCKKGFIDWEDGTILRRTELFVQEESSLEAYEQISLHWIWDLMNGTNELDLNTFDTILASREQSDLAYMNRIKNLLDVYCSAHGLLPLPGEKNPSIPHVISGFMYFLFAVFLSWLGSFYLPLMLLLPAIMSFVFSFTSVRYTSRGYYILGAMHAYKKELENIDIIGIDVANLIARLDRDFIASIALECNREYLLNLRYILPLDALIQSRFLSRFGFQKVKKIVGLYTEKKGELDAKQLQMVYLYIHKRVNKVIGEISKAMIKDRVRPIPYEWKA